MARREVLVCDVQVNDGHGSGACPCGREATRYTLWRDGDRQAATVDLCVEHAAPLEALLSAGSVVDLPVKQRARMEPTALRVTPKTAHLKKHGDQHGQTSEGT